MIIGLDVFGKEEYAHTRYHDLQDWIIPCVPDTKWTDVDAAAGRECSDNVTEDFGCIKQSQFETG
jgi:hypothetical protein